jgi:hypothetical protein
MVEGLFEEHLNWNKAPRKSKEQLSPSKSRWKMGRIRVGSAPRIWTGFFSMGPNSRVTKSCDTSQILRYLHRPADLANISHCLN